MTGSQENAGARESELIYLLCEIKAKCENYLQTAKLPLTDAIHREGLQWGVEEIHDMCKEFSPEDA